MMDKKFTFFALQKWKFLNAEYFLSYTEWGVGVSSDDDGEMKEFSDKRKHTKISFFPAVFYGYSFPSPFHFFT